MSKNIKNRFVYLFEEGNFQLLIKKTENEEGKPKLSFITQYDGAEIDFGLVVQSEDILNQVFNDYEQIKSGAEIYLKELNKCTSLQDFIKGIS